MSKTLTNETLVIRSVEAADHSWWGYSHAEPTNTGPYPPLHQLVPTHIAMSGAIPKEILDQQIEISRQHCPCHSDDRIAVPITATFPPGTVIVHERLGEVADAYANAG